MSRAVPKLFAEITAKLEDLHAVAIEGQRSDNSPDMQRVLASQLRMDMIRLDAALGSIKTELGDDREGQVA